MNLEQLKKSVQVIEACCETQAERCGNFIYDIDTDVQIELSDLKQLIAAANCLPELVSAIRFTIKSSMEKGPEEITNCIERLDAALAKAETVKP